MDQYSYDPIGNLIRDNQEKITIDWTVYGKINSITNDDVTKSVTYAYDPAGKRASKTTNGLTTFYVRDAQGNPLAIYDNAGGTINWKEQDLYGSSRLGTWTPGTDPSIWLNSGNKQYELQNHLGNVLATVSDRRLQEDVNNVLTGLTADVITAQDYYPFGMLMPGRQFISETSGAGPFRYGFNGKENDNEVKGVGNQQDYGMRIYDPRVGKFLSVDPLTETYPYYSPYLISGNNPIKFNDLNGLEEHNPVPESYVNPNLKIDMTHSPGSNLNAAGFVRNSRWFWDQMLEKHPEMISQDNVHRIKDLKKSPIVDEQWVKYNETQGAFMGETLIHHHEGQGNLATPLPESVHRKWFSALHENTGGRIASSLGRLNELGGFLLFLRDMFSSDPHALGMQFSAGTKTNTLYYDLESDTYFNITSIVVNKDKKGNAISTSVTFDYFLDYDYDSKSGKYIGVGKLGTKESTKNERTGKVQDSIIGPVM